MKSSFHKPTEDTGLVCVTRQGRHVNPGRCISGRAAADPNKSYVDDSLNSVSGYIYKQNEEQLTEQNISSQCLDPLGSAQRTKKKKKKKKGGGGGWEAQ